ncbi:MAG: GTPase RsgA, partial [Clostridia bacterium]|nr:GTPase RsgA [Clostridia bacterium]
TVNGIREDDSKGRHTTTHRQLVMLKNGAMIIDTPGMRELGMWDVSSGLSGAFGDVESFLGRCKYRDCTHDSEPGCAIKLAIESGELPLERWESYKKLRQEAKYTDDKESFMKRKREWHKNLSKFSKEQKKIDKFR